MSQCQIIINENINNNNYYYYYYYYYYYAIMQELKNAAADLKYPTSYEFHAFSYITLSCMTSHKSDLLLIHINAQVPWKLPISNILIEYCLKGWFVHLSKHVMPERQK